MLVFDSISDGKNFILNFDNKSTVFRSLIEDIKDALIFDKTTIVIFTYEKDNFSHILSEDYWIYTLNKALEHFEYIEDYEECIEIRDLITVIEEIV
jgi:hypothetical protein